MSKRKISCWGFTWHQGEDVTVNALGLELKLPKTDQLNESITIDPKRYSGLVNFGDYAARHGNVPSEIARRICSNYETAYVAVINRAAEYIGHQDDWSEIRKRYEGYLMPNLHLSRGSDLPTISALEKLVNALAGYHHAEKALIDIININEKESGQ